MIKKSNAKKTLENTLKHIKRKHVIKTLSLLFIAALFLLIVTFFLGNTITFFTQEEMEIILEPKDELLSTYHNINKEININFYPNNFAWCDARCSYNLRDLTNNEIIDFNEINLIHKEKVNLDYILSSEGIIGQKMFLFEVSCNNIKTTVCRTSEKKVSETSLITVNFDIDNNEIKIKEELNQKLLDDFNKIKEIDTKNIQNDLFLNNLNQDFAKELKNEQEKNNNKIVQIKRTYEKFRELWETQQYNTLNNEYAIFVEDDSIDLFNKKIINDIDNYNSIIDLTENYLSKNIDDIAYFYNINESYEKLLKIHEEIPKIKNFISTNNILRELLPEFDKGNKIYIDKSNEEVLKLKYILLKFKFLLDQNENIRLEYDENIDYIYEYNKVCDEIEKLKIKIVNHNNEALALTKNLTDLNFKSPLIQNNLTMTFNNKVINILNEDTKKYFDLEYNDVKINKSDFVIDSSELKCDNIITTKISKKYNKISKIQKTTPIITSSFSLELKNPESLCCIYGDCKECCKEDECKDNPELYPILFIHGHSFKEGDKPEHSLNTFKDMQSKFEDSGYINAGEIDLASDETNMEYGYLGKIRHPVTFRGTYYYIKTYDFGKFSVSTQKEDKIENYAIRLKEIVDIVKFKTGMDKINIIAHSMGGLVTREYINIFGTHSINKVALISVPNKGLARDKKSLCTLTGANRECEDLSTGSIFLERLNSKQKNINIPILNIIGMGCSNNGDGVVASQDAYLDFADNIYINGTCTDYLGLDMHLNIVNPEYYPQVYNEIVDFLK